MHAVYERNGKKKFITKQTQNLKGPANASEKSSYSVNTFIFFFRRHVREESSYGPGRGTTTEEEETKLEEEFIEAVRKIYL